MTNTEKMITVMVLGTAASMPYVEDTVRTVCSVLANRDGVSCGVCEITIDIPREQVSVELRKMVVAQELVVAALLLCPHCAAKWKSRIHFVLKVLRPENPIGAPDVKAGDARALH